MCCQHLDGFPSNNSNRRKHSPADMMRDCKREVKNEFRSKSKEGLGFQLCCWGQKVRTLFLACLIVCAQLTVDL